MLKHPVLNQLQALKLTGMLHAFQEQLQMSDIDQLSFEERFGLLVERELTERANRRLQSRLQRAKLRQAACMEDIDYRHAWGLDKALMQHLAGRTLAPGASELLDHRANRGGENLVGLRVGPSGLPPRLYGALPAPA